MQKQDIYKHFGRISKQHKCNLVVVSTHHEIMQ